MEGEREERDEQIKRLQENIQAMEDQQKRKYPTRNKDKLGPRGQEGNETGVISASQLPLTIEDNRAKYIPWQLMYLEGLVKESAF